MASLSSLVRSAGRTSPPDKGLAAIAALRAELEALERHHVAAAIAAGWSWRRVAEALGVSKQAAHKKHARQARALAPDPRDAVPANDRVVVTGEARAAVRLAREEARAAGTTTVGTEHLLLGVLRTEGNPAVVTLAAAGVTVDAARAALVPTGAEEEKAASDSSEATAEAARATGVSPLARTCLEDSLRETLRRGDGHLGPEHLLLSLVCRPEGGAARTLEALGVPCETVRRKLAAAPSVAGTRA